MRSVSPATQSPSDPSRLRIGVSACLLGERVRYDGGHKRAAGLIRATEGVVEWVQVCPEVEVGMGTPRETLHLRGGANSPRLVTTETDVDHTDAMVAWARARIASLACAEIDGFVLKTRSPSCGLASVPVQGADGENTTGRGVFAAEVARALPDLPLADEEQLADPVKLTAFLRRVATHRELRVR